MSLICSCLAHRLAVQATPCGLRIAGGCGCSVVPDGFVAVGKEDEDKEAKTGGFAAEKRVLQSKSKAKVKAKVTKPKVGGKKPKVGKKPKK